MADVSRSSVRRRKKSTQTTSDNASKSKTPATERRHDLDNLRTFLTGLVILHHTSNCYGGPGGGPYKSPLVATAFPASRLPLFVFNAVNHSFFMGLFLWVSGRNSSQSLRRIDADPRRSRWAFVRSKILRLGLPALFYTLVLEPAAVLAGQVDEGGVAESLLKYYSELDGIKGPVWYTANLLIFDVVAALFSPSSGDGGRRATSVSSLYIPARKYGWIMTTVAAFLIRLKFPVGTTIKPIALQVAFAPQYVFAYMMGFASTDQEPFFTGPFTGLPTKGDKDKSAVSEGLSPTDAALLSILLLPLPQIPQLFGAVNTDLRALGSTGIYGGWNWAAFLYALWNELSFTLVAPAVAGLFYRSYNQPIKSSLRPRDAYGAFMVHMAVSSVIERGVDCLLMLDHPVLLAVVESTAWKSCGLVLMTGLLGAINVVASFSVARFVLETLPTLRRII